MKITTYKAHNKLNGKDGLAFSLDIRTLETETANFSHTQWFFSDDNTFSWSMIDRDNLHIEKLKSYFRKGVTI